MKMHRCAVDDAATKKTGSLHVASLLNNVEADGPLGSVVFPPFVRRQANTWPLQLQPPDSPTEPTTVQVHCLYLYKRKYSRKIVL